MNWKSFGTNRRGIIEWIFRLSQDKEWPNSDSNREPPEYKSRGIAFHQPSLFSMFVTDLLFNAFLESPSASSRIFQWEYQRQCYGPDCHLTRYDVHTYIHTYIHIYTRTCTLNVVEKFWFWHILVQFKGSNDFTYIISMPYYATDNGTYKRNIRFHCYPQEWIWLFSSYDYGLFYLTFLPLMRTFHTNYAAKLSCIEYFANPLPHAPSWHSA
jgi:hypothetical protein